jgi:hypothetical protein
LSWVALIAALGCQGQIESTGAFPPGAHGDSPNAPRAAGEPPPASDDPSDPAQPATGDAPAVDTCAGVVDVAATPLRRLTRTEYERMVADVFGIDDAVANGFAPDERIDGVFASNISSPVALVQVRQFLDAAESISSKVQLDKLNACDRAKSGDETCAYQFIDRIGRRAYRRPLATDERDRYRTLYAMAAKLDGYDAALRLVVQAFLQSPHTLYHLELDDSANTLPNGIARLAGYALASRLSFYLWSSAPDETLLDAAASGALDTDAGVLREARRLMMDARARGGIESFHAQWLGLTKLDTASRDAMLFPEWSPDLVQAMRDETTDFSDYVIRDQSGDLTTLLTASYSFPTGPGVAIRGAKSVPTDGKLELDPAHVAGLLTQPAFLAAHAHSDQTSPILRGRALRERLFCQPLPDPPPDVAAVAPPLKDGLTTRERYAMHRTAGTSCAGCHSLIDDLGFALEHFDAIGRYRDKEQGKPIDAHGMLTATDVNGPIDGARALAERMSESDQVRRCYAKQWFRYALGRTESDVDRCALERVEDAFMRGGSIRDLLVAISTSDAFLRRKEQP